MSTKKTPPGPPPSSSDPVLAAIEALTHEMRAGFATSNVRFDRLEKNVAGLEKKTRAGFASVRADVAEVRDDLVVVRTDLEITTKKMEEGFAEAQGRAPVHAEPKVGGGTKR